jgi:hypothetical protein
VRRSVRHGAALLIGLATCVGAGAAETPTTRFAIDATLTPASPSLGDDRFQIQGAMERLARPMTLPARGLVMKATLAATDAPVCYGPGYVFADSFEQD